MPKSPNRFWTMKSRVDGRKLERSASFIPKSHYCPAITAPVYSAAAKPRLCRSSLWARRAWNKIWKDWKAKAPSALCIIIISLLTRSAKPARTGGPGRREIGHGALAEKALAAASFRKRRIPLYHPRRFRNHGLERFVFDGLDLLLIFSSNGCGRAD